MVWVPVSAIHGGAGTVSREALSAKVEHGYRDALQSILEKRRDALATGASTFDAVTLAVSMLEDCPLFSAGRGTVYTGTETHEMDTAIMDDSTLWTGALSCVHDVRNPIRTARVVMEQSPHVLMADDGVMAFPREHGVESMPDTYFNTERRLAQLYQAQARQPDAAVPDHDDMAVASKLSFAGDPLDEKTKMDTVGTMALDNRGNLAVATSTGGMTNKLPGQVGDTPIVDAGCYVDDGVAVSCTSSDEYFIRLVVGHDVAARVRYQRASPEDAIHAVLARVGEFGGTDGLIAMDKKGHVTLPPISEGMYRGCVGGTEAPLVAVYGQKEGC